MHSIPAFLLLIATTPPFLFAQVTARESAETACGPGNVKFETKNDKSQHAVAQPEAGKALVYMIQYIMPTVHCLGMCVTSRVAVDGDWVGANHHNSYFSLAVDPGEHHLCVRQQTSNEAVAQLVVLAHFTAEAGKVYYFRTRMVDGRIGTLFDVDPIDSDMGKFYVASLPLSVSHPKK